MAPYNFAPQHMRGYEPSENDTPSRQLDITQRNAFSPKAVRDKVNEVIDPFEAELEASGLWEVTAILSDDEFDDFISTAGGYYQKTEYRGRWKIWRRKDRSRKIKI